MNSEWEQWDVQERTARAAKKQIERAMRENSRPIFKADSQNQILLSWLLSGGSVTRKEAHEFLHAGMCLSSRISELKKHGFPIKSTPERHGKAIVHRYSLPV